MLYHELQNKLKNIVSNLNNATDVQENENALISTKTNIVEYNKRKYLINYLHKMKQSDGFPNVSKILSSNHLAEHCFQLDSDC